MDFRARLIGADMHTMDFSSVIHAPGCATISVSRSCRVFSPPHIPNFVTADGSDAKRTIGPRQESYVLVGKH